VVEYGAVGFPGGKPHKPQNRTDMNLNITYSGCFRLASRESAIGKALEPFRELVRIEQAKVRVERLDEGEYPFRVNATLVTPGPDLVAEGRDYTFEAALRKLRQSLNRIVRHRREKRARRQAGKDAAARGVQAQFRG
jgi:ribosome-associated translation inhibitor RaiA